jgi:hypothetical protein
MSRAEIARRFALAAREAEHGGKHRRAAELYAEALRVLLDKPSGGGAAMSRIEGEVSDEELAERGRSHFAAEEGTPFDSEPPPAPSSVPPRNTMVRLSQKAAAALSAKADADAEDTEPAAGALADDAHLPRVG